MGICSVAPSTSYEQQLNYEQIQSVNDASADRFKNACPRQASTQRAKRRHRAISHSDYRVKITRIFIAEIQMLLSESIQNKIISFVPWYFQVYGIGAHLTGKAALFPLERLHALEAALWNPLLLLNGNNKFLIHSHTHEIYGIGCNEFGSLCSTSTDSDSNSDYALTHFNSLYHWLEVGDQDERVVVVSNSLYSNDAVVQLSNGSVYASSLTMGTSGGWTRKFIKRRWDVDCRVVQIECGLLHSLFLASSGVIYACGSNVNGQCGLGHASTEERSIQVVSAFVEQDVKITNVHCGQHHNCAIDAHGGLFCWGKNTHHQCSNDKEMGRCVVKPTRVLLESKNIAKAQCGQVRCVLIL